MALCVSCNNCVSIFKGVGAHGECMEVLHWEKLSKEREERGGGGGGGVQGGRVSGAENVRV